MPAVARGDKTDSVATLHDCDAVTTTDVCSSNVFVNGVGVHRQSDTNTTHTIYEPNCPPHAQPIAVGSISVFVNGLGIARLGDAYSGCGIVSSGSANVFAGPYIPSGESNGDIISDDCSSLVGYTVIPAPIDHSDAIVDIVGNAFYLKGHNSADATITKDVGSIPTYFIFSVLVNIDYIKYIGIEADFKIYLERDDFTLAIRWDESYIYIHDGDAYNAVTTHTVGSYSDLTFEVDLTGGASSAICNLYIDTVLRVPDIDCSNTTGGTDGTITFFAESYANGRTIEVYVDSFSIGSGFSE